MSEPPSAQDWALFGLEPGASQVHIRKAYERKRVLYDEGSLATYSLFAEEERREHLQRLEAAFCRLTSLSGPAAAGNAADSLAAAGAAAEHEPVLSPGTLLRRQREARGTTVSDLSARTKIRPVLIEALEAEDYGALPAAVYVRGFVTQIARLVGLPEPETVAGNFLARMARHRKAGERPSR